jgi:hypothetical protein
MPPRRATRSRRRARLLIVFRRLLSLTLLLPLLASCGAGIITGAVLSKNDNKQPPPAAVLPELSLPEASGPLVPAIDVVPLRTVVISNFRVDSSAALRVELRALGVVDAQVGPIILSSSPGASVVAFVLNTEHITTKISDLTADNVDAQIAVLQDEVEVAKPVPFLLRKQPVATLVAGPGQTTTFLSVLGGTKLTARVNYLIAQTAADVQIQVAVTDPAGGFRIQRCTNVQIEATGNGTEKVVTGNAPPSGFSGRPFVAVVDSRAGSSTLLEGVFYLPALDVVSPRTAPTEGGIVVTLAGTAMIPYDYSTVPPRLDFPRISVLLRRGGRESLVPAVSMRPDLSSPTRIVFTVPPSPDGRAGPANVTLRVEYGASIGEVVGETTAVGAFVYGYGTPVFGPRGVLLSEAPTRIAIGALEGSGGTGDLAVLSSLGGLPRVNLFASSENGLFTRLGASFEGGQLDDPQQRVPTDLLATDLNGDSRADLLVLNKGSATTAMHGVLLGQAKPEPPITFVGGRLQTAPGPFRVVRGDFDEDGVPDLVLLYGPAAPLTAPEVWMTRLQGTNPRLPVFTKAVTDVVGNGPFDCVEVADLDGDGHQDLALARGGSVPHLATAYGDGRGGFVLGQKSDLVIPGYTAEAGVPAVALHACALGPVRSLALVLAGKAQSQPTRPTIAVVAPDPGPRTYAQPNPESVTALAGADQPLAGSVAADLDGDRAPDLLLAHGGVAQTPLRVMRWLAGAFVEVVGAVEPSVEPPRDIEQLIVDGSRVYATHTNLVDEFREHRVGAWLIAPGFKLLAPDAARGVDAKVTGLALGDFRGRGTGSVLTPTVRAGDAWVASVDGTGLGTLQMLENDGVGTFSGGLAVNVLGLVPGTLRAGRLSGESVPGDGVLFLTADGRLGYLGPRASVPLLSALDLRRLGPTVIQARKVSGESRIVASDVDGDGLTDVTILLTCELMSGERKEGEALLILLRGIADALPGTLPLATPLPSLAVARVHGNASAVALGDLVREASGPRTLEAMVAIPNGDSAEPSSGNHVRFFRYDAGAVAAEARFVRSYADPSKAVLVAGDRPQELVAADFDGNGTIDLAIASTGDGRVRIFLNGGALSPSGPTEVNIGNLLESFGVPPPLPAGRPHALFLVDLNGDQIDDLVISTRDGTMIERTSIATYLSSGNGGLSLTGLIPQVRSGDLVGDGQGGLVPRGGLSVLAVDDVNKDGVADMLVGWNTSGTGDKNLRVLFGGAR